MKLSFHGGVQEVTGSCYLVQTEQTNILVDCGMFQGADDVSDVNFNDFAFDPGGVHALLVTHAHLDHVGRIPRLVQKGFHGRIISTAATRDLARLILEDALSLAQREERQLFDEHDIERSFSQWDAIFYHEKKEVGDIAYRFNRSGHILGSALVELWAEGKRLLFTGDLGNVSSTLLEPPEQISGLEYLVIESTYGNRMHEQVADRELKFERAIEDVAAKGGALMIPAFATERTQDILYLLNEMVHFKRVPDMPVFVDAPLATRVTEVYEGYGDEYRQEIHELMTRHPNLFRFKRLTFTESVDASKHINDVPPPKVIIAGSGMMTGGRILHHARRYLPDPKSMLLIIGYQSPRSLGHRLLNGAQSIHIFGEEIPVNAEIRQIDGFSAHADAPQLFSFVEQTRDTLKRVFVVHGEETQASHLSQEIRDRLGVQADVPALHEEVEL
ncbi:MAG: MBL fold metallo-hydrolase [Candidatus Sungbacteria bacterium]|nr:MBL fold metallo-hydrolase [Candidatus Sungbacteria bacterium]